MFESELLPVFSRTIGDISQLTVDARALHAVLQVRRDFSNWIKDRISKYGFVEGEDFEKSSVISSSPDLVNGDFKGLRQAVEYSLSLNMGKELAMVENNETGRMVRRYFIACEQRAMQTQFPSLPNFSNPALAARAWAEQYEQRQLAESQRDEAIRTKAWISDKKTASAMATASVAVRKAAALENELGRGRDYKAVKGIPWFLEVFSNTPAAYSVAGRKLSELSRRMGYEILEVEDSRFGSVKAYHIDVIESFRLALRNDLNMLGKYRSRRSSKGFVVGGVK